jgi:hypothetical protein
MADPTTTNLSLFVPANAADPGTWDQPVNANSHTLDNTLGSMMVLNAQGLSGVVALTLAQYICTNLTITGVPAGALTYQLPAGVGRFFFVQNLCTGANSTVSFASASVAGSVAILSGVSGAVVIDPTYGARRADSIAEEAAGPLGAVQYAGSNGFFAGDAGLVYAPSTQTLTVGGPLAVGGNFAVTGQVTKPLVLNGGGAATMSLAVAYAATGMSLDCSKSNVFTTTLTGSITGAPAFANVTDGQTINWRLQQDGTGSRTMAWPASFRWPGGTAGVLSTGANAVDLMVATWFASSGTWLANLLKAFA